MYSTPRSKKNLKNSQKLSHKMLTTKYQSLIRRLSNLLFFFFFFFGLFRSTRDTQVRLRFVSNEQQEKNTKTMIHSHAPSNSVCVNDNKRFDWRLPLPLFGCHTHCSPTSWTKGKWIWHTHTHTPIQQQNSLGRWAHQINERQTDDKITVNGFSNRSDAMIKMSKEVLPLIIRLFRLIHFQISIFTRFLLRLIRFVEQK